MGRTTPRGACRRVYPLSRRLEGSGMSWTRYLVQLVAEGQTLVRIGLHNLVLVAASSSSPSAIAPHVRRLPAEAFVDVGAAFTGAGVTAGVSTTSPAFVLVAAGVATAVGLPPFARVAVVAGAVWMGRGLL